MSATDTESAPIEDSVKRIALGDPGVGAQPRTPAVPGWIGGASWLVAPLMLVAVFGAVALVRHGPTELFVILLFVVCGVPVVWGLVSVFFPAAPDRKCPECHRLALEPISQGELRGLHCTACDYLDRDASAWKFVEEGDQPLEPIVLGERTAPALAPRTDPKAGGSS